MLGSLAHAQALDAADPLRGFRDAFVVEEPEVVYLKGNSLGRMPRGVLARLDTLLNHEWGTRLVRAWNEGWADAPTELGDRLAPLIGARPGEVLLADSTSVNLYKLAKAALVARPERPDVVSDATNFPSDLYVLARVADEAGGTLRLAETPEEAASLVDERTGLFSASHVAFKSGALADMATLTARVQFEGAWALWDLSHSVGIVDVELVACGVDLAVGCTYKYLNGGPGAPAFLYVRSDLQDRLPAALPGWFGHANPFAFDLEFAPAVGIRRFLAGTPPILSMFATERGIDLAAEAGIDAIREKSMLMTEAFLAGLPSGLDVLTPREMERRGGHVAIRHPEAFRLSRELLDRGVVCDFREPDCLRCGFSPLWNTFEEVWRANKVLNDVLASEAYLQQSASRPAIT